ncbi:transcription initiation factor IIB [Candidatus Bathyarchaeota archaeon]|nr:transcription initiation factor IIB [Candidatus Bathyarchaeota archaeon]
MNEQRASLKPLLAERCPECGASLLMRDQESAEVVCTNCGFVVATKLADRGAEWRAFTPEQHKKRARVGTPYTFTIHDKGLSTRIDWRDIRGFPPEKKMQLHRLRKWQRRVRVSGPIDKKLAFALSEMHRMAAPLNLPKNILETASVVYRKAIKKRLIRGRSVRGMVVAAIYLACRQCGLIRTLMELSQASGINKVEVARNYRFLVRELNYFVPPVKPRRYAMRLSNQLSLRGKVEEVAHRILKVAGRLRLTSGKGARGVAAAASYMASKVVGEYRTQREFAEAADITEVTIRNRYKEMMERLLIVISL